VIRLNEQQGIDLYVALETYISKMTPKERLQAQRTRQLAAEVERQLELPEIEKRRELGAPHYDDDCIFVDQDGRDR